MLIRQHRGQLQDSLSTSEKIGNTIGDVQRYVFDKLTPYLPTTWETAADVKLTFGPLAEDKRCPSEWRMASIVSLDGYGVFGMVSDKPRGEPLTFKDELVEVGILQGNHIVFHEGMAVAQDAKVFMKRADVG